MSSAGGLLSGLGDLVGGIFGFLGENDAASMYNKAAATAEQNVQIQKESTAVQENQTTIGVEKTLGAQQAAVGAAGFTGGGSAQELLRSSAQQASLAKSLVAQQGLIQENSFQQQADAAKAMAQSSSTGGIGDLLGGVLGAAGSVIGL